MPILYLQAHHTLKGYRSFMQSLKPKKKYKRERAIGQVSSGREGTRQTKERAK